MTGRAQWLATVNTAANAVEAQFGEQVDLIPWESEQEVAFTEASQDTTREAALDVRVLFVQKSGDDAASGPIEAVAKSEAYFVIRQDLIDQVGLTQNDRIRRLDENDELFKVNFIGKSSVRRPRVYVSRVRDPNTSI